MGMSRRDFLTSLVAAVASGHAPRRRAIASVLDEDPARSSYSIDLETFWAKQPFLDRLKSLSESGFKSFEFSRFKTKDVFAISKASRELDLTPVQFTAYQGIIDPKRKANFLQALDDAIEVAELLEVKRLVVGAGETLKEVDRERQIDTLLDALSEAVEKVEEMEITLLLDPLVRKGAPARRVAGTIASAAELVAELNSPRVKLLVDLENGWQIGSDFSKQLKEASGVIGSIRLSERRLANDAKIAGLDPADFLKLIWEVRATTLLSIELGLKSDPVESLDRLRGLDQRSRG